MAEPINVRADYDGDGNPDEATWNPADGQWRIQLSGGGVRTHTLGAEGDIPVPADHEGVRQAEVAVVEQKLTANKLAVLNPSGGVARYPWADEHQRPDDTTAPRFQALTEAAERTAHNLHVRFRFAEAVPAARLARDLRRKLYETGNGPLSGWAHAAVQLGSNLALSRQFQEGIIACYEGLDAWHQVGDQAQLGGAYRALSNAYHLAGRFSEAVPPSRRDRDLFQALSASDPLHRRNWAIGAMQYSGNLSLSKRHQEAIEAALESVGVHTEIGHRPDIAESHWHLSIRYNAAGDKGLAEQAADTSAKLWGELFAEDAKHRESYGEALIRLSGALDYNGKPDLALTKAREAEQILRPLKPTKPEPLAKALAQVGRTLFGVGRPAEAVEPLRECVEIYTPLFEANPDTYRPVLAPLQYLHARALLAAGTPAPQILPVARAAAANLRHLANTNGAWEAQAKAAEDLVDQLERS